MMRRPARKLVLAGIAVVLAASPVAAQEDVEAARRAVERSGVSPAEVFQRLRASGMSPAEIRSRLVAAGYDPALVDAYLSMESRGSSRLDPEYDEFLYELEEIGVTRGGLPSGLDTLPPAGPPPGADTGDAARAAAPAASPDDDATLAGLPIFGRSLFAGRTTEFEPTTGGPVPSDYRLGPGDQLVVILSGAAQTAYTMEVMRDGTVVVPDAGPVAVNGLTLAQAESLLLSRLGESYSGLGLGDGARTRLSLSVGRIRTSQVVVAGDVERPGTYAVSSLGTALTALYRAGGPSPIGSFRRIQVRRNGVLAGTVDLYDYLIDGRGGSDVRLEQGDFLFVPVAGARVAIEGAVRRPAAYELEPGEGLADLLRFAGGPKADAVVSRIRIDRILPPAQRRPGVDRVVVDADLASLFREERDVALSDGDVVRVFAVSEASRQRVAVTGAVHRPGTYQWRPGMTVAELLDRAEGLAEQALTTRAHIYRLDPATGQRRLTPVPLATPEGAARVPLEDRDSLVVLSRADLAIQDSVVIDGFVKRPGTYALAEGMTAGDLILRAGGYRTGADTTQAEVARMPSFETRSDTVAEVFRVLTGPGDAGLDRRGSNGPPVRPAAAAGDLPAADGFRLAAGDRIFVRKAPGYEPLKTVVVTGEVLTPSEYVLDSRRTRITDVIDRAGGLTDQASIRGVQLFRRGDLVAVDLDQAWAEPGSRHDFALEAGDSLHVPRFDPTVLVVGKGVAFETRVPYRPGAGLAYYIAQSGGYTESADRDRVSVTYQNGQRGIADRLLLFRRSPRPEPGSTVLVPELPPAELRAFDMARFASTTLGLLTSAATVLVLLNQLRD